MLEFVEIRSSTNKGRLFKITSGSGVIGSSTLVGTTGTRSTTTSSSVRTASPWPSHYSIGGGPVMPTYQTEDWIN